MTKALVDDGDGWIVADGDEGGHVEGASYRSATPHDHAAAAESAAVPVHGGDADKSRHLAAIQKTQFREMSQSHGRGGRTDAGNTAQKVVGLVPYRAGPDRVVDIVVDLAPIAFQRTDMFIDSSTNRLQSHRATVFLGDDHLHDLLSTDGKGAQLGGFGI